MLQLAAALGPPVTSVLAIRSRKAAASRSTPKGFADSLFLVGFRRSFARFHGAKDHYSRTSVAHQVPDLKRKCERFRP